MFIYVILIRDHFHFVHVLLVQTVTWLERGLSEAGSSSISARILDKPGRGVFLKTFYHVNFVLRKSLDLVVAAQVVSKAHVLLEMIAELLVESQNSVQSYFLVTLFVHLTKLLFKMTRFWTIPER